VCAQNTPAFATIVATIPDSMPVPVQAVDSSASILFATTTNSLDEPQLTINLRDIARLPTMLEIRAWSPDSSWAWTRCEVLAHELAETIAYREIWRTRPSHETLAEANAEFGTRLRKAHLAGLRAERSVAEGQHTRVDAGGGPYPRTRECFVDGAVHVEFRSNTETIVINPSGSLRFIYYPHRSMCGAP